MDQDRRMRHSCEYLAYLCKYSAYLCKCLAYPCKCSAYLCKCLAYLCKCLAYLYEYSVYLRQLTLPVHLTLIARILMVCYNTFYFFPVRRGQITQNCIFYCTAGITKLQSRPVVSIFQKPKKHT